MHRDHPDPISPPTTGPASRPVRRWVVTATIVAVLIVGGALTTSLLIGCLRRGPDDSSPWAGGSGPPPSSKPLPERLFRDWPANRTPDVALILTGQQHSYLKFCGCSNPQLGGF